MGLTLTRKVGEKIVITTPHGDEIEIHPTEIRRNQVRVKVSAPKEYAIDREEILEEKKKQEET